MESKRDLSGLYLMLSIAFMLSGILITGFVGTFAYTDYEGKHIPFISLIPIFVCIILFGFFLFLAFRD